MPEAQYEIGDSFPIQFAWRLPNNDYLRAVFRADIVGLVPGADKYVVRLSELIAGRQETEEGEMRPKAEFSQAYWDLVGRLIGNKISVAYEADDGRALYMRLTTLTGEHNFFTRFDTVEEMVEEKSRRRDDNNRLGGNDG